MMNRIIEEKLKEIEKSHQVRILFACESGSRAWGFPSPDSDFDVRFFYIHPEDWYLYLHEHRDVMDFPISHELDVNGWDLRKALRLVLKHNAVIYEWLQSPIVYVSTEGFVDTLFQIASSCFSPIASLHHYLSSAKKHFADCHSENVKLKKYFYCLRNILAAEWTARNKTVPPMELNKLLALVSHHDQLVRKIKELVKLKGTKEEAYLHPREPILDAYLKEGIAYSESVAPSLPGCRPDMDKLNAFFLSILRNSK